jgi:hypothetical protein
MFLYTHPGPRHNSSGYSLASHRSGPGSSPGLLKWDLWWTKWRWGRISPSTSVSPANLHSTKCSIIIITRDRYNRPFSGRRAEWTHLDSTPHYANLIFFFNFYPHPSHVNAKYSSMKFYKIINSLRDIFVAGFAILDNRTINHFIPLKSTIY